MVASFRAPRVIVSATVLLVLSFVWAGADAATVSKSSSPRVSAQFELVNQDRLGVLDPGKPLELAVHLTGLPRGRHPIVVVFEGRPFVRRLLPMKPVHGRSAYSAVVTLEPYFTGFTSPREKALRVKATFARMRGMRLIPVMSRVVYITMALPEEAQQLNTAPFSEAKREEGTGYSPELIRLLRPGDSVDQEGITEEDLLPDRMPVQAQGYWQRISHLINRSWIGPSTTYSWVRGRGPLKVRFRLHANGDAQLIQVEKSSGVSSLDDAGMQAIVDAHPFPPFPSDLESDSVDMHVELTRSARTIAKPVRSTSSLSPVSHSPRP